MPNPNPPSPLPTPMALNLMKRRRVQYRLRRRQYVDPPAAVEAVAAEPGAPAEGASPADAAELLKLRDRARVAEELAVRLQAERHAALGRAREAESRIDALAAEAEARAAIAEAEATDLREKLRQSEQLLAEARRVADQAKAQVMRSRQDLEQQRRRAMKEAIDLRQFAAEGILREIFPVLDHFSYAMETLGQNPSAESLSQGIQLIHRELGSVLGAAGLEQLLPLGEAFDPQRHDAASTIEDPQYPDGAVAQVLRPGYALNGKVLRPAMVAVNKLPSAPAPQEESFPDPDIPAEPDTEESQTQQKPLDQAMKFLETRFDD